MTFVLSSLDSYLSLNILLISIFPSPWLQTHHFPLIRSYFYSFNQDKKKFKKVTIILLKASLTVHSSYLPFPVVFSSLLPAEPQGLSNEGKDVSVLQDGLGSGFPCTVSTTGVYPDHQRLALHRAAAHPVLQGSAVLQGVQRHHTIIVICCQKQDSRVGRARVRWLRQIMERWIPEERVRETNWKEKCEKTPY